MRVAILSPWSLPWHRFGGLERHVFELCRALRRAGVAVDLYTATPEREADPFAGDGGFALEPIAWPPPAMRRRFTVVVSRNTLYPLFSLRIGWAVARRAVERRYDAVIAQGLTAFGFTLWRECIGVRIPLLLNPQGMEEAITPSRAKAAAYSPFRALVRYAARRAERVIATDDILAPTVHQVLGVERSRVVVLPNAVDVGECRALADPARRRQVLAEFGLAGAGPRIVTVGRLAPNKGHLLGLEALHRVREELPRHFRWAIVGDGPERRRLETQARRLGLSDHVRFLGTCSDPVLHTLLSVTDLFLNPTLYEGSSLVTLEAMAHALPVVASAAGGIPDKIIDGETGWLAPVGDAAGLAAALRRWLAADEGERRRIGEAAFRRCRERFDWSVIGRRYLEVIQRLGETPG